MRPPFRIAAGKDAPFSASSVLEHKLPAWRSRLVLFGLCATFATLVVRAVWIAQRVLK